MELILYRSSDTVYIIIEGRFVLDDCLNFKESISKLLDANTKQVAVDLENATFIDSAGLGALVSIKVKAGAENFRFTILSPSVAVNDILTVSKLCDIFDITTGLDAKTIRALTCVDANKVS